MSDRVLRTLKQTKPFASLEEEAAIALAITAEHLAHEFAQLFKAHGLSGTQYNILRILRGAGANGLPCGEIGQRLIASVPDITRLLDRLEERGLITRERDKEDRRVVLAHITDAGRASLAPLDKPVFALQQAQFGHLGPKRLRQLILLLDALHDREP